MPAGTALNDAQVGQLLKQRSSHHRAQGLSAAQTRARLESEGFPAKSIDTHLPELQPEPTPEQAPEKNASSQEASSRQPASQRKPAGRSSSRGGRRGARGVRILGGRGSGAGLMLAIIVYPAGLAYLTGGTTGFKAWLKAKFLNQTPSDPGINAETWITPPASGGASGPTPKAVDFAGTIGYPGVTGIGSQSGATGNSTPAAGAGAAIAFARAQLGKPYKWGAKGPNRYDCSGLTQAAWRAAGVRIGSSTWTQVYAGHAVSRRNLAPGDLVFPYPGHVQLYIGGGQVIEAPHTGADVRVAPLGKVWKARRV